MSVFIDSFKWLMVAGGVLTLSMLYPVIAPAAALRATFGQAAEGPVAEVVTRSWGSLICLSAAFVIWAAFEPAYRTPALLIAIVGKLFFAALVFTQPTLRRKAAPVALADVALSGLYALGLALGA
jgi:hypothetical protein